MTTSPDQRASISQAFLAAIVECSNDAIIGKDLEGIITSWNKAAERIFGYSAEEAIGQPITLLIPDHLHEEETMIHSRLCRGETIEHYETVRRRKDGTLCDISLTISPVTNAEGTIVGASKIARDVTERKKKDAALRRQTKQLELLNLAATTIASDLDLEGIVQRVTDLATTLTGAKFGAFFYNVTHRGRESYLLYTLSGAPREAFEKLGLPRATPIFQPTFHGAGVIRSADIRADPRYGKNPPHRGMPDGHLPVVSYLAVPVISRSGDVIGGLFFGHDEPSVFTKEAEVMALAIAAQAAVSIDNARLYAGAQEEMEAKELLIGEFRHRLKNSLAMVQAIAGITLRSAAPDERETFIARVQSMSRAQDALATGEWGHASVNQLISAAAGSFPTDRFVLEGPDLNVEGNSVLHLTMALHELMTNAAKYGALSNDGGKIHLRWSKNGDQLVLAWREDGGPRVKIPASTGFGSLLIRQVLNGRANFEFAPAGLRCTLTVPLKA